MFDPFLKKFKNTKNKDLDSKFVCVKTFYSNTASDILNQDNILSFNNNGDIKVTNANSTLLNFTNPLVNNTVVPDSIVPKDVKKQKYILTPNFNWMLVKTNSVEKEIITTISDDTDLKNIAGCGFTSDTKTLNIWTINSPDISSFPFIDGDILTFSDPYKPEEPKYIFEIITSGKSQKRDNPKGWNIMTTYTAKPDSDDYENKMKKLTYSLKFENYKRIPRPCLKLVHNTFHSKYFADFLRTNEKIALSYFSDYCKIVKSDDKTCLCTSNDYNRELCVKSTFAGSDSFSKYGKNILLEKCEHTTPICTQFDDDFINAYYKIHPHPASNTNITICSVDIIPGRDLNAKDINTVQNCNGKDDNKESEGATSTSTNTSPINPNKKPPPSTKDEPTSEGLSVLAIVLIIIGIFLLLAGSLYLILKKK